MLSGEGQHHLASAAVAVCKGIECLLEVLCLEHMRGDLIDLFQVVRQDLDHLGELLILMTGPQNGQFLCIDAKESRLCKPCAEKPLIRANVQMVCRKCAAAFLHKERTPNLSI